MNVLIAGGGQVGALLARRLIREGNAVTIVDPSPERCAELAAIAARHGLYRANCLHQSLALCSLLRRDGLQTRLRIGVEQIRTRQQERDRATRLQAILEIAAQWQQTHEMNPLLVQMAETGGTGGSEEGSLPGLGLIPARTVRFQPGATDLKVPHMGWNEVRWTSADPLVEGLEHGARFYFVHSYYVVPDDPQVVAIEADYHRFQVPEGSRWADLHKVTENLGVALQNMLDRVRYRVGSDLTIVEMEGIFGAKLPDMVKSGVTKIVVDLTRTVDINISLVKVLLLILEKCEGARISVKLMGAQGLAADLKGFSEMAEVPIYATIEEAKQAF